MAAAVSKALGAKRVIVADIDAKRLELAAKLGADVLINSSTQDLKEEIMMLTGDDGIERLVEASGKMVDKCFSLVRKGAQIVLIGLPQTPIHIENPLQDVLFKSITLKTVHGRKIFHTWEQCEQLIATGQVNPNVIVSHELPMTNWEEAFRILMSGKCCKIVVDPQQ